MGADIVIGLQWGDEAKGRFVDYISENYDVIVRFQGGANAGHTVIVQDKKYIFHLLPSGLIRKDKIGIIGAGVLIDPDILLEEISFIEKELGPLEGRFFIDERANIVLPYHKEEDFLEESSKKGVGSTRKGIAYAYRDLYMRMGIRLSDLKDVNWLSDRLKTATEFNNQIIGARYGHVPFDWKVMRDELLIFFGQIRPYVADTVALFHSYLEENKKILFEGAQGTMLDIFFGTYPFVTSSHTISSGAPVGSGIPPTCIGKIYGVFKAYTTRVGKGPFPTELTGEEGKYIREKGNEYGATTGRPRRCGWLDLPVLRYSAFVNGVTDLVMTKLDVLSGLEKIKVAVHYKLDGKKLRFPPTSILDYERLEPHYIEMEGFELEGNERSFQELSENAKKYVNFIEDELKIPVKYISVGPRRDQLIVR